MHRSPSPPSFSLLARSFSKSEDPGLGTCLPTTPCDARSRDPNKTYAQCQTNVVTKFPFPMSPRLTGTLEYVDRCTKDVHVRCTRNSAPGTPNW